VYLDFAEHGDRLLAGLTAVDGGTDASWLPRLSVLQVAALFIALAGFCRLAGADVKPVATDGAATSYTLTDVPLSWTDWVLTWELDQLSDKRLHFVDKKV
jgi:hypothetical protein